jgi:hypothetical protein
VLAHHRLVKYLRIFRFQVHQLIRT